MSTYAQEFQTPSVKLSQTIDASRNVTLRQFNNSSQLEHSRQVAKSPSPDFVTMNNTSVLNNRLIKIRDHGFEGHSR